ncbi:MAG: sigma-70 family RNA polymerase sigma factor [Oscillospiraceae bacterium]|nr:sigma-70 family RNA polymerase sigma factor [Oscillospiraceae bacterium]
MGDEMSSEDELKLVRQAKSGDTVAEEALIRRYTRLVESCARAFYPRYSDTDDLIQDGMLGLLSAIRNYDPKRGASLKTFALLCVRRRMYSALRRYSGNAESLTESDVISDAPTLEEEYIIRERNYELLRGLENSMSDFEKQTLDLYLDGLTYNEIASRIGKPAKSVDNAIQRIRRKISRLHE